MESVKAHTAASKQPMDHDVAGNSSHHLRGGGILAYYVKGGIPLNIDVKIAKRENNTKRTYLYVNPWQGKHMPCDPGKSMEMFHELAERTEKISYGPAIVIGFAETATAIAARVAADMKNVKYMAMTTRENTEHSEVLFFTESHSHATDQKLVIDGFDEKVIADIKEVIFVEDEVTTGNTILKLIREIKGRFPGWNTRFVISSVLNSMTMERIKELKRNGIECIWLSKIGNESCTDSMRFLPDESDCNKKAGETDTNICENIACVEKMPDQRKLCMVKQYAEHLENLCKEICKHEKNRGNVNRLLVLGTEEFMYPAIFLAERLKDEGISDLIFVHATTRSPIMAYPEEGYPLHVRYELESVYDPLRKTFIYNLDKYDRVIVLTDAFMTNGRGHSLAAALSEVGNKEIAIYNISVS